MLKSLAYAGLISTALAGSVALAQSTGDANQTSAAPNGGAFVKEQTIDQWRAPKLVGVAVYDADNKKIGFIADVLIDHSGNAQLVVIGVGGFLGLGTKEVAVPFKSMQWRTEARAIPTTNPPAANPLGATGGESARPAVKTTDPAATEAAQGYPDRALLSVTLAQLQAAPDFEYAPSPLAVLDLQSPAAAAGARPQEPRPQEP